MQLDRSAIVIRPRSVASLGDLSFRFVLGLTPRLYLALGALFVIPAALVAGALRYLAAVDWGLVWLWCFAYATVLQGIFTVAAGQLMFRQRASVSGVFRSYLRRFWVHLGVAVITRLLAALAMPFFGLGLLVWSRYCFVHEAALLEGHPTHQATQRAAALVRSRSGETFSLLLLTIGFGVGSIVVFEALGRGLFEFLLMLPPVDQALTDAGGSPFAVVGFLVSVPFAASLRFLAYIDARTRGDGWDIQVAFMSIESASAGPAR